MSFVSKFKRTVNQQNRVNLPNIGVVEVLDVTCITKEENIDNLYHSNVTTIILTVPNTTFKHSAELNDRPLKLYIRPYHSLSPRALHDYNKIVKDTYIAFKKSRGTDFDFVHHFNNHYLAQLTFANNQKVTDSIFVRDEAGFVLSKNSFYLDKLEGDLNILVLADFGLHFYTKFELDYTRHYIKFTRATHHDNYGKYKSYVNPSFHHALAIDYIWDNAQMECEISQFLGMLINHKEAVQSGKLNPSTYFNIDEVIQQSRKFKGVLRGVYEKQGKETNLSIKQQQYIDQLFAQHSL